MNDYVIWSLLNAQALLSQCILQDSISEAQDAAQQSLASAHAAHQEAKCLAERHVQLQSSVESLKAAYLSARQEVSIYSKPLLPCSLPYALHHTACFGTGEDITTWQ